MTNNVAYSIEIQNMILANLDGWQVETVEDETVETIDDNDDDVVDNDVVDENNNTTNDIEDVETETPIENSISTDINPFMTVEEATTKPNKLITSTECQLFYEEALDLAYAHTNRLNIDDLTSVEARIFTRAVCKWAASNLWNKYNIRVNNEDMEDTYVQSYGGLLYKSALKTLQQFVNQRITNLSGFSKNKDTDDDIWIV